MNLSKELSTAEDVDAGIFNSLWHNNSPWFETPNIRRGGWSGVVKCPLTKAIQAENVFIKRQENHVARTLNNPVRGVPTFFREYRNIKLLKSKNISTIDVLYFEMHKSKAIMVTKALEGFSGLDKVSIKGLMPEDKNLLLVGIATELRKLHQNHLQHSCLYPKHIMVKRQRDGWEVKLIDLEKLKYRLLKKEAILHDLSTLFRYLNGQWSAEDEMQFFKAYFDEDELTLPSKNTIRLLNKKIRRKAFRRHKIAQ